MPNLTRQIVESGFELPEAYSLELALPHLLRDLGSPDAAARAGALAIFSHWIGNNYFSKEELDSLLDESLNGIRYKLGHTGDGSVFVRSWLALLLLELIHHNLEHAIFDSSQLELIYNTVTDVFLKEQDYRAVVRGKGWAYAIPHIADNFLQLSQTEVLEPTYQSEIPKTVGAKLRNTGTYVFGHLEDERLAYVVFVILKQGTVTPDFFEKWIADLTTFPRGDYGAIVELSSEQHAAYNNVRAFLRSLNLQLRFRGNLPPQAEAFNRMLEESIRRLDPGFYTDFAV